MKKLIFALLFLVLPISLFSQQPAKQKVKATLFYSSHCGACHVVKNEILPKIKEKYKDLVEWDEKETSQDIENWKLLEQLTNKFLNVAPSVPTIVINDSILVGRFKVEKYLEKMIDSVLSGKTFVVPKEPASPSQPPVAVKVNHEGSKTALEKFHKISLWPVLGAGLIDGINPCAFAVIILFISFLAVHGYSKRAMIYVGVSYCASVYLMYFLIGMGLFNFLYMMQGMQKLMMWFNYLIAGLCFCLAGLAIWDFIRYKRTHDSQEMLLQLPNYLKKRIALVIGDNLRGQSQASPVKLVVSACIVGQVVSLLEAVCTGQVYLPLIVYVLKTTKYWPQALGYLILYNLMFILPLVIIFILSLAGVSSQKFSAFLKQHLGVLKICMAILFLGLGALILFIS